MKPLIDMHELLCVIKSNIRNWNSCTSLTFLKLLVGISQIQSYFRSPLFCILQITSINTQHIHNVIVKITSTTNNYPGNLNWSNEPSTFYHFGKWIAPSSNILLKCVCLPKENKNYSSKHNKKPYNAMPDTLYWIASSVITQIKI